MKTRVTTAAVVVIAAALALTACITGPIEGIPSLNLGINPASVGSVRSETFLFDEAKAYKADAPLTTDGEWDVSVDEANSGAGFKTRLVTVRPPAGTFNGTVVVEWLNVTGGADLPVDWLTVHNEFTRSGTMWVGVSAQVVGVNQLASVRPDRYGSLFHPGDSYSYDIFTKAAQAARTDNRVTGGLRPKRVIGTGQSQSAGRLVTYINAVQPLEHAFDGFLVHGRGAGGASLSQSPLASVPVPSVTQIRADQSTPVFTLQAEDDVIRSNTLARQPDSNTFRLWEVPGGAHLDAYIATLSRLDDATPTGAQAMFDLMRSPGDPIAGCAAPQNAGSIHWVAQAAFHHLDAWIRSGTLPPIGPRIDTTSTSPTVLARDAVGNATGGVRSVQVEVPVARIDGINSGGGFCGLFGSTTALTTPQLQSLYSSKQDFVDQYSASLTNLVASGFLLQPDANELLAVAQAASLPELDAP